VYSWAYLFFDSGLSAFFYVASTPISTIEPITVDSSMSGKEMPYQSLFNPHRPKGGGNRIGIEDNLKFVQDMAGNIGEITLVFGREHNFFGPIVHGQLETLG
jgi:hypothetical protein